MRNITWRAVLVGATCLLGLGGGAQALAGASASSFMPEGRRGENYFNANSAIDNNPETAWMVPGGKNTGEWIVLDMPKCTIDKLGMSVGYLLNEEAFTDYARVKSVTLTAMQYNEMQDLVPVPGEVKVNFEDKREYQIVDLQDLEIPAEGGGKLKITVDEVYPGQDYDQFAISELLVYLTEFDVATTIKDVSSEPSGSNSRIQLVDDNVKTYWYGDPDTTISFEAPGYTLSQVGILPGPSTFSRPKKIELTVVGRTYVEEIPDTGKIHWIQIPAVAGYTGSAWGAISLKILEVYPGSRTEVAISELDLKATSYLGF